MNYCWKCGAKLTDQATFCIQCGAKQKGVTKDPFAAIEKARRVSQTPSAPVMKPNERKKKKKKGGKFFLILLVLILMFILLKFCG